MRYLIFIGLTCFTLSLSGQTILFKETFNNSGYYDGPASLNALYDNNSSMYSDDYVRIANTSTVSNYPGASGGSYIYLGVISSTVIRPMVVISGINTSGYTQLRLSFGAATWYGLASNYMEISYSTDGISWTLLDDNDLLSGYYVSAAWGKLTLNQTLPSAENLRLKINITSTSTTVRFDDLEISGWQIENTAPGIPLNLNYSDLAADRLLLQWDASADSTGIARYDIYEGPYFITSSGSNRAWINYLTAGTSISLKVQAVDYSGNKSVFSDEINISIPEIPANHIYSWERQHAKVLDKGDLEWQPEDFVYQQGSSPRYIDFEGGIDSNDGLTRSTPWQHHPWDPSATGIAKNCTGIHSYVFKRGVVYRGTMEARESGEPGNPIRLTSDPGWGSGDACIFGSKRFTSGWSKANSIVAPKIPDPEKVWYQEIIGNMPNTKVVCELVSGQTKRVYLARTPNFHDIPDDPVKSWPVWTGKAAYDNINKNLWLADSKNLVQPDPSFYAGGTVWSQEDANVMSTVWGQIIKQYDPSNYRIAVVKPNFGGKGCHYYIENTPFLLDSTAEYYYDNTTKRIFIRLSEDMDPNTAVIEVATTGKLILIDAKHDIEISGLKFGFTTSNAIRWDLIDFVACIQLTGSCYNISISNNKFNYVNGAIAAKNTNSRERTSHDIEVTDNDMQDIDDMAIAFIYNGSAFFDQVRILRNRIYNNGARHLGAFYGNIPAITAYLIDGEVAGNIVDVSWGNGVNCFWGKSGTDSTTSLPFIRGLVHHNKASNTLLGCNDYGGIENWQGGPAYCYNNLSQNASGYKHFNNTSIGYAFYHDGAFKQYIFNNIASGTSWNRNSSGFMQVLGFYNMWVQNTGYRMNSFQIGAVNSLDSGGHNSYLGNLGDSVSYQFKTSLKPYQVAFESYGNNVFSKTPFMGGMATDDAARKNYWNGKILVNLETFKNNLKNFNPQKDQVGIEAMKPVIPNASDNDFRPDIESEAIDRGVKFFASFPLYAVVGEWNFYKHPADSSIIMADNFYMTDEYSDRETYYTVANNDLKAHGITLESFVKGQLEDWTEGALNFDGIQSYCELDNVLSGSKVCTDVDMTTNDFIIEVFFRTDKGHTGGVLVSKSGLSSNGYQLDIDEQGKPRFSFIGSGTPVYSISGNSAVNDSSWHHVLAEINRAGRVNIFIDGKINNGISSGTFPQSSLSLVNTSNLLVGKNHSGAYFKGAIDFLRLSKGKLTDARTTIQELYKWELDGPFLKDFTGKAALGKRDAGALEVGAKTCDLSISRNNLEFVSDSANAGILVDSKTGFEIYRTQGTFFSSRLSSDTLIISVPENLTTNARSGEIWITGCNDSRRIPISQAGAPCKVDAEHDTIIFSGAAGDTTINISMNSPLALLNNSVFLNASFSPSSDKLFIWINSNTTSSTRSGYVYIYGCLSDTVLIIQESALSVNDLSCPGAGVYPNPLMDGKLNISIPCLEEKSRMTIQDLSGKILYEGWLRDKNEQLEFGYDKGFYILKVYNRLKCYTFRILVI